MTNSTVKVTSSIKHDSLTVIAKTEMLTIKYRIGRGGRRLTLETSGKTGSGAFFKDNISGKRAIKAINDALNIGNNQESFDTVKRLFETSKNIADLYN